jgi:acyl dehydratase
MKALRNLTDPRRAREGVPLEGGLKSPIYENIHIPEEFGPVDILVDDFKVKRFALILDDFDDWYLRAGPEGRRIAHAGILGNDLLQLFTTRYAPSEVVGLHTEEQLWFHRPILLGETVRLAGRYTEKYERRGQGYVVMEAEARDVDGELVLRHRGIEIMRTAPAEVGGRGSAGGGQGRRVTGDFDSSLPLVERLDASAVPGMGLLPIQKDVLPEQMALFSRIGEYVTNIHNDLRSARAANLNAPIVQGQQLVCNLAQLLTRAYGLPWFYGGWLQVKLLRPVLASEHISLEGAVSRVAPRSTGTEIEVEVWIRREDASLAAVGWATGTVPNDQNVRAVIPAASTP